MDFIKITDLNQLDASLLYNLLSDVTKTTLDLKLSNLFEADCEGILTVIFFNKALFNPIPWKEIQSLRQIFVKKWFGELNEIHDCLLDVVQSKRIASFATLLLLYILDSPSKIPEGLQNVLQWKNNPINAPCWLNALMGTEEDSYYIVNIFLYEALKLSSSLTDSNVILPYNLHFGLMHFLKGVKKYKQNNFEDSLAILRSIENTSCSQLMQAWIHFFSGRNLFKLNKLNSSLLEFKKAFQIDSECLPALYSSALILEEMNKQDAFLETLELLSKAEPKASKDLSLQTLFISICFPLVNISLTAIYIKATSALKYKMYDVAEMGFKLLLSKLKSKECPLVPHFNLLKGEDEIPPLPPYECILTEYLMTLMNLEKFEDMSTLMKRSSGLDFITDPPQEGVLEEIRSLSVLLAHIMSSESMAHHDDDAAIEASTRVLFSIEWTKNAEKYLLKDYFLAAKSKLFQILHDLYSLKDQNDNSTYYQRLWSFYKKDLDKIVLIDIPVGVGRFLNNITSYLGNE